MSIGSLKEIKNLTQKGPVRTNTRYCPECDTQVPEGKVFAIGSSLKHATPDGIHTVDTEMHPDLQYKIGSDGRVG